MIKKGDLLDDLPKIHNRLQELEDTKKIHDNLMSGQNKYISGMNQRVYDLEVTVKKLQTYQKTLYDIVVPRTGATSTPVKKR